MKGEEMLVVSLRGVNFQFRAPLGCTGQKAIIIHLTMNVFRVACKEIYICLCFNMVSFRGQNNPWAMPAWAMPAWAMPSLAYFRSLT